MITMVVLNLGPDLTTTNAAEQSQKPKTNHRADRRRLKQREARKKWRMFTCDDRESSLALWVWIKSLHTSNQSDFTTSVTEPDDNSRPTELSHIGPETGSGDILSPGSATDGIGTRAKRYRPGPDERSLKFCSRVLAGNIVWSDDQFLETTKPYGEDMAEFYDEDTTEYYDEDQALATSIPHSSVEDPGVRTEMPTQQLKRFEAHLRRLHALCDELDATQSKDYLDSKNNVLLDSHALKEGTRQLSDMVQFLQDRNSLLEGEVTTSSCEDKPLKAMAW
ncbi:hypothetical protein QBC40DRAFT_278659 [Triangularia verruculosa]|uniref:Uncharacterized protein n=1 Tax=Triangularia verruculosa TaxID=2587418 RepID=A0AAN6XJ02_9PEZI|nr:hypothetical protein QBC40DRAFT_278659 [Triangularia verruculosa]